MLDAAKANRELHIQDNLSALERVQLHGFVLEFTLQNGLLRAFPRLCMDSRSSCTKCPRHFQGLMNSSQKVSCCENLYLLKKSHHHFVWIKSFLGIRLLWGVRCRVRVCKSCNGPACLSVCRLDSVSLDIASPNVIDLSLATEVEHCECPQGYAGISCEVTLLPLPVVFLFSFLRGWGKSILNVMS